MSLLAADFHFVIIYSVICFQGRADEEKQVALGCVLVMVMPASGSPRLWGGPHWLLPQPCYSALLWSAQWLRSPSLPLSYAFPVAMVETRIVCEHWPNALESEKNTTLWGHFIQFSYFSDEETEPREVEHLEQAYVVVLWLQILVLSLNACRVRGWSECWGGGYGTLPNVFPQAKKGFLIANCVFSFLQTIWMLSLIDSVPICVNDLLDCYSKPKASCICEDATRGHRYSRSCRSWSLYPTPTGS